MKNYELKPLYVADRNEAIRKNEDLIRRIIGPENIKQMKNRLYLEQRISIVREALNGKSISYQDALPAAIQQEFKQYILDMMSVLDGDVFGDARERLRK